MMSIATDQMTWVGELVDMKNHKLPVRQAKLVSDPRVPTQYCGFDHHNCLVLSGSRSWKLRDSTHTLYEIKANEHLRRV